MKLFAFILLAIPLLAATDDVFTAIRNNDLAAVKKADLTVRDRRGNTPLLYAGGFGSVEALRLLLDAGADVNARNSFDATPLIWAAANRQKVALLLAHGADVNAKTKQGRTPLMIAAACSGCSDVVKLLLEKGADPKAEDVGGETALTLAAGSGDNESLKLLLAAGSPPDAATKGGETPLMRAAQNCNAGATKLLLAKSANPNARNTFAGKVKFGEIQLVALTPLLFSAAYCGPDVVDPLLEAGADVNAKDIRGMTPLMLAVASETQDASIVRRLVHAGADVNAKSKLGETALDWAGKYGDRDVISILTAEGAAPGRTREVRPAAQMAKSSPLPVREAVNRATGLLQKGATEFFRQSGCVGCHNQPIAVMASASAQIDGTSDLVKIMSTPFASAQDNLMQRLDPGGGADGEGYTAMALSAVGYPPDALTDVLAVHTAAMQRQAGNWHVGDTSRAPIQESEIARTARGMRTLQLYGPPSLKAEFENRIARARDFILEAHAKTNDDFAMQLVGAHWAGVARKRVDTLGRTLTSMQRPDGGWGQNANLASDAYATGESLWALREAGILSPADPGYQRGVKFLLGTQFPDGAWYVRSRAPKFQPYFESGFPFGHDQWVSSMATGWAVMALAPAVQKEKK